MTKYKPRDRILLNETIHLKTRKKRGYEMATVKDVARAAGVSLGTVSNVLNGKESVKPESREKVYQAIEKLGFQYNMTASALRTKATKNVGLIIPTIVNPYYPELARGVEDEVRKMGCTLFLCNSDREEEKERQYINALLSRGTDGLILVKTRLPQQELEQLRLRTALVLVDYKSEAGEAFCIVNVNDTDGVVQGMGILEDYGHNRIAYISGLLDAYSSRCRMNAYKNCLKKRGIDYRPDYVVFGDYSWSSGYEAARKLLSLEKPPTAIFAANDIMAMGAMKAAAETGIPVPKELSIIGFDDIEMSELCSPALTTIHQPKYQVGLEAVRILMQSLNKQVYYEEQIWMDTSLVCRESVAKALR